MKTMLINAEGMDFQELNETIRESSDPDIVIENCLGQRYIGSGTSGRNLTILGTPGNALAAYMDGSRINAGFMVLEPKIFDFIEGDSTVFEKAPLETVASMGELDAYIHNGFWKPMDTLREKMQLEEMWANGTAPWKVW